MYQGFNIDITALDHMQTQLSRAERLATLGQVAAGIAHEIRNPLVGIGSTAALLREDVDSGDPRRADLDVILNETRRLDRIVNQIIDYARPREFAPGRLSLCRLIHEVLKLLDASIAAKRISRPDIDSPMLPQLQADRDQLKQVLLNVFQNAIEAMGTQGTLTIAGYESRRSRDRVWSSVSQTPAWALPRRCCRTSFSRFSPPGSRKAPDWDWRSVAISSSAHAGDIHTRPANPGTARPCANLAAVATTNTVIHPCLILCAPRSLSPTMNQPFAPRWSNDCSPATAPGQGIRIRRRCCSEALDQDIPDLILLDLKMPGMSGIDTLKQIRPDRPHRAGHHVDGLRNGARRRGGDEAGRV